MFRNYRTNRRMYLLPICILKVVNHAQRATHEDMTVPDSIPDEIKRFILVSVPSVPYLEAILLLRSDALHGWDNKRVALRLYTSDKEAAELLARLHACGILTLVNQELLVYRYLPQSDELKHKIDLLADTYAAHLVDVTNLIHSKIDKKAHSFADAFVWRKEP